VKPALVILAAGASTRLGTCKALVDLGGSTPLVRLLTAARGADVPLVIGGRDIAALRRAMPDGVEAAFNPDWELGRLSGVRLAADLRPGRDLLIAPVDVPLVPSEVFETLLAAWQAARRPARGWLGPSFEGRNGHPVLAGRELLRELTALPADASLRELRVRAEPLWSVPVDCERILDDLDTGADLERLRLLAHS
jgi:CTP:molybdopterin cytidylyltransferase MocA